MKVLLVSPLGFSINKDTKYAGIERLVWEFSRELTKQGHSVSVIGPAGSEYPQGVLFLPASVGMDAQAELKAFQMYGNHFRDYDVIHDFSHHHFASRFSGRKLPIVSAFWHAPALAQYPKAPYNIVAPSKWAASEFQRAYHQKARYQDIIIIDPAVYKPGGERGNRFMCLGRMASEKGNLNAVMLCKELGLELDVCGGRGYGETEASEYEKAILSYCDGIKIRYFGEVSDAWKVKLMQTCKGLLYITSHPEATNHKLQEAMFCKAPVVAPDLGAQPEIVTHGINGWLCGKETSYEWGIRNIETLRIDLAYDALVKRWRPETIVKDYVKLYREVAQGAIW